MFGKGIMIYVVGFGIVFSMYQLKLNRIMVRASDNFNMNYMKTLVHEAAMTGANFGINEVWANSTTDDTFTIVSAPCTSFVEIAGAGVDSVYVKVVSRSQVFEDDYYAQYGTSMALVDSIIAYFVFSGSLAQYAWFTGKENGITWTDGDTIWGPIHSNHILHVHKSPVFYGKVTAKTGISPSPTSPGNKGKFYGGWEIGIDMVIPTDMSRIINAATTDNGAAPINTKCLYDQELHLEFLVNGDVVRTVGASPPDTVALTTIAPTGAIHSSADIHVSGVVNGQVTLHTDNDIWIDDNIVYDIDPLVDPNATSFLGLIADNNVIVADNIPNTNDVTIHANILAVSGGFAVENLPGRSNNGILKVVGSIAQAQKANVGSGTGAGKGYTKKYYFDPRCSTQSSPYFPNVGSLRLVSWWE
ncbi:MAG: hypothetical protein P9L92_20815 [Candidatus Electryonea clarkiae]|nr:hypothetical protein [Candidatus Electryonea clarkiae]MDP8288525.1 hypothetical protein [Candidatus Electryonea clarkiae]